MKKLFLIIVAGFVLLLGAGVFVLRYKINDLVAQVKPSVEAQLSESFGAPVTLGAIQVSFFPEVSLSAAGMQIAAPNAPTLGKISVRVPLRPLLSGTVQVTSMVVDSFSAALEKRNGAYSIVGLKFPSVQQKVEAKHETNAKREEKSNHQKEQKKGSFAFDLQSLRLHNGAITVRDDSFVLTATDISLSAALQFVDNSIVVPDLNLTSLVGGEKVSLGLSQASLKLSDQSLSAQRVVFDAFGLSGQASLTGKIGDLAVNLEQSLVDLHQLQASSAKVINLPAMPQARGIVRAKGTINLGQQITLKQQLALEGVGVSQQGIDLRDLSGEVALSGTPANLSLTSEKLAYFLQGVSGDLAFDSVIAGNKLPLNSLKGTVLGATVSLKGSIRGSESIKLEYAIGNFKLEQLSRLPKLSSFPVTGVLKQAKGEIAGSPGKVESLRGSIVAETGELAVKDMPALRSLASALAAFPNLKLKPEEERVLKGKDLELVGISLVANLDQGKAMLHPFIAKHEFVELKAEGVLALVGDGRLTARLRFSPELSERFAKQSKKIERLLDQERRLSVPVVLVKKDGQYGVEPDIDALAKMGAVAALEEKAEEFLGKAFKGKGGKTLQKLFGR